MPNFKIREVSTRTRDWDGQGGSKNRSYYVKVDGDEKVFELAQKADKAPPAIGDAFEANVEEREHEGTTYYKLKKVYQQRGGPGGGRPRDPQEQKRIAVQASQKVAVEVVRLGLGSLAPNGAAASVEAITDAVEQVTERLFRQVEGLSA